jgi:hypothetical protein
MYGPRRFYFARSRTDGMAVYLFKTTAHIINGISSPISTIVTGLVVGEGKIIDFKFLDDKNLLILWTPKGMATHIPSPEPITD